VDALERPVVVAQNERAHLLRLEIVRVVIAGAQHIRAEHDPALHFRTEPTLPRPRVHRPQILFGPYVPYVGSGCSRTLPRFSRTVLARSGPISVPDAVIARQVRARLGGGGAIVYGSGVLRVRQSGSGGY